MLSWGDTNGPKERVGTQDLLWPSVDGRTPTRREPIRHEDDTGRLGVDVEYDALGLVDENLHDASRQRASGGRDPLDQHRVHWVERR